MNALNYRLDDRVDQLFGVTTDVETAITVCFVKLVRPFVAIRVAAVDRRKKNDLDFALQFGEIRVVIFKSYKKMRVCRIQVTANILSFTRGIQLPIVNRVTNGVCTQGRPPAQRSSSGFRLSCVAAIDGYVPRDG